MGIRSRYSINHELSLPAEANPRYRDLAMREEIRTIGGDKGDLEFQGYTIEDGKTILYLPVLVTTLELNEDEAYEIAQTVLLESFESIGVETVEHS